jgi:hypothetical protein
VSGDRTPGQVDPPPAGKGSAVADVVRRAVLAGVGALFLTEEGARKLAREWKLPKELISYVGSQAASAKGEILRIVSDEVRKFFESEALRREFVKALSSLAVEIHAEIRVKDAGDGKPRPEVRATVRPRVGRRRGPGSQGDPG